MATPLGAVEAGGYGGRAVVQRLGAHPLSDRVGAHDGVGREQRQKGREFTAAGGGEEGLDDKAAFGARGLLCGRFGFALYLAPCPARQLAYGGARASQGSADLVEPVAEDVVQHERCPLGRREGVEDDVHRRAHPLGE